MAFLQGAKLSVTASGPLHRRDHANFCDCLFGMVCVDEVGGGEGETRAVVISMAPECSRNRGEGALVGGRWERTLSLLALVVWSLTTHFFQGGALFPVPAETSPSLWCSFHFSHGLHANLLEILSRSCLVVFGHHLSPRVAIVFSVLSDA